MVFQHFSKRGKSEEGALMSKTVTTRQEQTQCLAAMRRSHPCTAFGKQEMLSPAELLSLGKIAEAL